VHNHAQTARNLRRSLRNAAVGARLIQTEGLDSKSATELAATLAYAPPTMLADLDPCTHLT
jgi:hypothetical protein